MPLHPDRLSAVILDWAGTTVDRGCLAPATALRAVLEPRGLYAGDREVRMGMGLPKRDHLRALLARQGAEDCLEELYPQLEHEIFRQLEPHAGLIDGTLALCDWMRTRGVRIGTTTGYSREMMQVVASAAARQGYTPDAVVTPDQVPAGRPAPFMIYQNALLLGVSPLWTVVKIGDTPSDITEGVRAGAWTVGVALSGNALGLAPAQMGELPSHERVRLAEAARDSLRASGADFVVDSVAECSAVLEEIAERIAAGARPGLRG